jgi:hypothetical protein
MIQLGLSYAHLAVMNRRTKMELKTYAVAPNLNAEERALMVETAKELGIVNGAVKEEMIKGLCHAMGLHCYNQNEVERYLASGPYAGKDWGWRAVREVDRVKTLQFRDTDGEFKRRSGRILNDKVYQAAIPLAVMLTMKRFAETVPDVCFYISDTADKPTMEDPFLLVTGLGVNVFIIEKWDEPAFKAKETEKGA